MRFDPHQRAQLEHALTALLVQHGAAEAGLADAVQHALDTSEAAFVATDSDGRSLSPLDVLRIRMGKFAAARVPAALFRDPKRLAGLRREIPPAVCSGAARRGRARQPVLSLVHERVSARARQYTKGTMRHFTRAR